MIVRVELKREHKLFHVAHALDPLRFDLCPAERGQKHACKYGDDCNHHQKFDQGEAALAACTAPSASPVWPGERTTLLCHPESGKRLAVTVRQRLMLFHKNPLSHAKSRVFLKLSIGCFGKSLRIRSILYLHLVEEDTQFRPRTSVADKPLPRRIAVQFRQKFREVGYQFFAFSSGEIQDRCFDFLYSGHERKVSPNGASGKLPLRS